MTLNLTSTNCNFTNTKISLKRTELQQNFNFNTFATKTCGKTFETQNGSLAVTQKKFLTLWGCKNFDDTPYVRKVKVKFPFRFNNYKSKQQSFRKRKQNVPQKCFHSHYVQSCHTQNYWSLGSRFIWEVQNAQATSRKRIFFCPLGLMQKKNIYFDHTQ